MPRLLLKKKEEILAEYFVKKNKTRIFIGSKRGNDIVVYDKNVSERHCTIVFENNQYILKDHNTMMGTQINSHTITEATLNFGDEIYVGSHKILFLDDALSKGEEDVIPQYYLIGIYGRFYGKKYFLKSDGDTFIGRENLSPRGIENDVVLLGDMTVSKGHAKISASQGKYTITDIGSTGGIAVNGEKLGQLNSTRLSLKDEISIGRTIFRVVDYFSQDYSLPAKQKIFILSFFKFVNILITFLVLTVSAWLMYSGYSSYSSLTSSTSKVLLSLNMDWNKEIPVKADTSQYDITSTPVIADFDKDGNNDVAMLSNAGFLYAWSGSTGDIMWKPVEISNSGIASVVAADVNNDSYPDIVAVADFSLIYIIDGQTGNIIRREVLGGIIETTPVVCDLNDDGRPDVAVVSEDGAVHFLYSPGFDSSYSKYTEFVDGPVYASPVILARKDFSPFVVIANYDSKVYFIDGKTRTKKTLNMLEATGKAHLVAGAPAVGDITGNGVDEVIVQSNVPQYVSAIDTSNFSVKWTFFVEPVPPSDLKFNSGPVVGDFNGDGKNDVAIVSANGSIQVLKGDTSYPSGELLWKLQIPEARRIISSPSVYDFDKDGIPEIVFGTEDGKIIVAKNNIRRKEIEVLSYLKASNLAITSSPLMADINGDGFIEILYTNIQDSIQVLNTNVKTIKNLRIWPMFLANPAHTSSFSEKALKMKYLELLSAGGLLLMLFVFFKIRKSLKKAQKRVKVVYL